MKIRLQNSMLTLLLPKGYERISDCSDVYRILYPDGKGYDTEMFWNLKSESYGNIAVSHVNPNTQLYFGDKEKYIRAIHGNINEKQGIIEVESGTNPRGYEYVYSIVKTYHKEYLNVNYCLHMNIRHNNECIEVNASFFETRITGMRSSMGLSLAMAAGLERDPNSGMIKGWAVDPYDPDFKKGCPMILAEKKGLDGLFPNDPLSQARELVLALTEDSYYKTKEELDAEQKAEFVSNTEKNNNISDGNVSLTADEKERQKEMFRKLFGNDAMRKGAYKVSASDQEIRSPIKVKPHTRLYVTVGSKQKKGFTELKRVNTPFAIPEDYRCKLNQPLPKELPGWGKRQYIGFGKDTPYMSGICISWPVTEKESLPLNDSKLLVRQYHQSMADYQGLIAAKCGLTHKGNRYAYAICKMSADNDNGDQQGSVDYELCLNIRIDGKIYFINGSFQANNDAPGDRDNLLDIMSLGSSELLIKTDHWHKDPYDYARKNGFLMKWTEDECYDDIFPYHPLSEIRRFVDYVARNN